MAILGAVVGQAAASCAGHTLTQDIQKPLRLPVDPVQVFKDEDQRLVETLSEEQLLERLERPSRGESARPSAVTARAVLQCPARQTDTASVSSKLRSSIRTLPVTFSRRLRSSSWALNVEVTLEQFDHRQIRRRFAMRHRIGFQHQTTTQREQLEFVEQPRLA